MTTIAYRGGTMAGDSCWTYINEQQTSQTKIARLKSGGLLGQAGDADSRSVVALFDTVRKPKDLPTRKALAECFTVFAGVLVLPGGEVFIVDCDRDTEEDHIYSGQIWPAGRFGFAAVGSGRLIALGAMRYGASARRAVEIACDFDINSKGPVHSLQLDVKRRTR